MKTDQYETGILVRNGGDYKPPAMVSSWRQCV
jgi:hypothetical protein